MHVTTVGKSIVLAITALLATLVSLSAVVAAPDAWPVGPDQDHDLRRESTQGFFTSSADPLLFRRGRPQPVPRRSVHLPILMYHYIRVNPDPNDRIGFNLSVTPAHFAAQLDYIASQGYIGVGLDALADYLAGVRDDAPPANAVVITFDDGYRDAYEIAYPLLEKHGFGATVFLITALVGHERYVTWPQIREMAAGGISFGAHTINHVDLPRVSRTQAEREIVESKVTIERELSLPVTLFCYPSGHYNSEIVGLAQNAGYRAAVTVDYGLVHQAPDRFTLPRVRVSGGETIASFAAAAGLDKRAPAPAVSPIWPLRPKGGLAPE